MNPENRTLNHIDEPKLRFDHNQIAEDPRDGLVLFGPNEPLAPYSVRAGVIGTKDAIETYQKFVERINKPFFSKKTVYGKIKDDDVQRPNFPGFEAVFNIKWDCNPVASIEIGLEQIKVILSESNKKKRTSDIVDYFLEKILGYDEDYGVNLWFILTPKIIYLKCRPSSWGSELKKGTKEFLELSSMGQGLLFQEDENYIDEIGKLFDSSSDFHHLLKARLIHEKFATPIQIILEPTLEFRDKLKNTPFDDNIKCHLAWTQSTTVFYKLGNLPWKLADVRDGVCYLGLVFKKLRGRSDDTVCSAAQMFLKDGDGAVFRGNIGLFEGDDKQFHLKEPDAKHLLGLALDDYYAKWSKYPKEIFIHGKAKFNDEEWRGFMSAVYSRPANTKLVGVLIKNTASLKLFRDIEKQACEFGVMRGLWWRISDEEAYLVSKGFVPKLQTSLSMEIPNTLRIQVVRGSAPINQVVQDVLALTKLNYNACIYGDGLPVTLRFSDMLGNILTATEKWTSDMRQFKFYI